MRCGTQDGREAPSRGGVTAGVFGTVARAGWLRDTAHGGGTGAAGRTQHSSQGLLGMGAAETSPLETAIPLLIPQLLCRVLPPRTARSRHRRAPRACSRCGDGEV